WGGSALFGWPKDSPEVNRSIGMWGIWMNGAMQLITGIYLMVGMSWFGVFSNAAPLYMAALAFTAFGMHWFAMGWRRINGTSTEPDAWMAIPFFLLSLLGAIVFFGAGDAPAGILFIGLCLIYLFEIPTRFNVFPGHRWVGLWQFLTGIWLMYLTYGVTLNLSLGAHWWI
ncbi:MAG: hypothetical protein ACREM6_17170, partial [Vulcanimicrobiaceae bacterium]